MSRKISPTEKFIKGLETAFSNAAKSINEQLPLVKTGFVIAIVITFTWVSLVYMVYTFGADWGPGSVTWLYDFIFYGTIFINIADTLLKYFAAKTIKGGSSNINSDGVSNGGSNGEFEDFSNENMNFNMEGGFKMKNPFASSPEDKARKQKMRQEIKAVRRKFTKENQGDHAPISEAINRVLQQISSMSFVYFIASLSLSFIEIIKNSSVANENCPDNGFGLSGLGDMVGMFTTGIFGWFLIRFMIFYVIVIILGGFNLYYLPFVGRLASFLPKISDSITKFLKSFIFPYIIAMTGLYIMKAIVTNPIVKALNGGRMNKVSDSGLNKLFGILIFLLSLILDYFLIQGGVSIVKQLIAIGDKLYNKLVQPLLGRTGRITRAESKASTVNINKYWGQIRTIKNSYKKPTIPA